MEFNNHGLISSAKPSSQKVGLTQQIGCLKDSFIPAVQRNAVWIAVKRLIF
jgi:hypothetical protein